MNYSKMINSLSRKILVSLGIIAILFNIFATNIFAQSSPWYAPNYNDFSKKVKDSPENEIFGERYTQAQVYWILNSLITIIGGSVAQCAAAGGDVGACLGLTQEQLPSINGGPILAAAGGIERFKSKPISSQEYIAMQLDRFSIPTANAQEGYGYSNTLAPILKIWSASRNAAYALSILVILVLAFMVMFRARLSPQTAITIQSALPKIVIALLFITFSYAIASFLVDLTFLAQGVVAALASQTGLVGDEPADVFQQINDGVGNVLGYGIMFLLDSFDGGILANAINLGAADFLLGSFAGIDIILALIVLILLLIALVRIFWLLLLTYTKFIFLVIAAPFIALWGAVQSSGTFSNWIKSLVAQLSVFFMVSVLILFAHIIYFGFGNNIINSPLASAFQAIGVQLDPFGADQVEDIAQSGTGVFPGGFQFGSNVSALGFFVSLVIMLSVPKIANSIRDYIATGRATFGSGVGEALGPLAGAAGGVQTYYGNKFETAYKNAQAQQRVDPTYIVPGGVARGYRVSQTITDLRKTFKF